MTPVLTILGLYTMTDGHVFDKLELPAEMDKDILIPEILESCSDFGLLYPDGDFMEMIIGVWSKKELPIWQAMYNSTVLEYNPIENYDRYEDVTREIESESSGSSSSDSNTKTGGDSTLSRTAFDSYDQRAAQNQHDDHETDTESSGESSTESSGKETVSTHMHGNIGVTTAAQMIAGYREISDFSPYDFIVRSFAERFCIQLY